MWNSFILVMPSAGSGCCSLGWLEEGRPPRTRTISRSGKWEVAPAIGILLCVHDSWHLFIVRIREQCVLSGRNVTANYLNCVRMRTEKFANIFLARCRSVLLFQPSPSCCCHGLHPAPDPVPVAPGPGPSYHLLPPRPGILLPFPFLPFSVRAGML